MLKSRQRWRLRENEGSFQKLTLLRRRIQKDHGQQLRRNEYGKKRTKQTLAVRRTEIGDAGRRKSCLKSYPASWFLTLCSSPPLLAPHVHVLLLCSDTLSEQHLRILDICPKSLAGWRCTCAGPYTVMHAHLVQSVLDTDPISMSQTWRSQCP